MKLSVVYQPAVPASASPYRVCDEKGGEVEWANTFLNAQCLRQLSPRSLRIYAYDLLDFARWFELQHQLFARITESTLVEYVRHQLEQDPKRSEEHTSELQSPCNLVCRLLLEKKKKHRS